MNLITRPGYYAVKYADIMVSYWFNSQLPDTHLLFIDPAVVKNKSPQWVILDCPNMLRSQARMAARVLQTLAVYLNSSLKGSLVSAQWRGIIHAKCVATAQ